MGRVIMSGVAKNITHPLGLFLKDISEGSIVKLNESGSPVEFYVVKHNYEYALNSTERTLLVRKEWAINSKQWNSTNVNAFASSNADIWLNSDYKNTLDADVSEAIGTTKFYYTPGNGDNAVTILERSVFLVSLSELDDSDTKANVEGSSLSMASILKTNKTGITNSVLMTRTPDTTTTTYVFDSNGGRQPANAAETHLWLNPCFTLPSTAIFDKNTLLFKGVA